MVARDYIVLNPNLPDNSHTLTDKKLLNVNNIKHRFNQQSL